MNASFPLSFFKGVIFPIICWIAISPWSPWLDLQISQFFYQQGKFISHPFWDWVYHYGIWPAWGLVGIALIGFFLSFMKTLSFWRKPCLFLILTLAIGSGLIIHAALKDHWGRPRPRQVLEFGGSIPFRPYYKPQFWSKEPAKSFTCGHASMGFYFFALALLGQVYGYRPIYWIGMSIACGLGGVLSMARIVQGGHFFSDTIATALIMWLTAWLLAYFLLVRYELTSHTMIGNFD